MTVMIELLLLVLLRVLVPITYSRAVMNDRDGNKSIVIALLVSNVCASDYPDSKQGNTSAFGVPVARRSRWSNSTS